jgi:hypothetical protein
VIRKNKGQSLLQKTESLPAPMGGINARDAFVDMPPTDCLWQENWLADAQGLKLRKGYREWATNLGAEVQSILTYFSPSNVVSSGSGYLTDPTSVAGKLFACTQVGIYDITNQTNNPGSPAFTLSNIPLAGWMSSVMFTNVAGSYLLACSEIDGYHHYNGATWVKPTQGAGAGQINGVSPANLVFVTTWKKRIWFVERNSSTVWYLPTEQITGTAVALPLGSLLKHGGNVAYIANWTIDAGEGIDDFLVIVGTNGDVLLYKGFDPSSASTFSLVGTYYIGEIPVGRRGFTQYGGDLLLASVNGIVPVSYVTRGGAGTLQASQQEYTSKIKSLFATDMAKSFNAYGWQMETYARDSLLLCSVPASARNQFQYAMSTRNNSWTAFTGIPILSLGISSGFLFAGTANGRVLLALHGGYDNVAYGQSVGASIPGIIQPAYSYFKAPGLNKVFTMVRPTFVSTDGVGYTVAMNTNFITSQVPAAPVFTPSAVGSIWGAAVWGTAVWSGGYRTTREWKGVNGFGFAGCVTLRTASIKEVVLTTLDYMYEAGGPV